ncbi:MAG: SIS domain-containing protein [Microbacteriaceae bacterium]|nr:SIS domain-containing protein [Microbacteriaceae bacterium]
MSTPDPLDAYISTVTGQLDGLREQADAIRRAGEAVAATIAADGLLHVFGTGHSHLLAEELFYRAGGLAAVNPVLIEGLLLHAGAELSTSMERTAGLGAVIFDRLGAAPVDTMLVATNSGSNIIARELVERARDHGMTTIAIVSLAHATSASSRGAGARRVDEIADIVIDNLGRPGDAAIAVPGVELPMGPTSTVMGAAIVNAVAMTAAAIAAERGVQPVVFTSSNVAGGDERNRAALERYRARVRSL